MQYSLGKVHTSSRSRNQNVVNDLNFENAIFAVLLNAVLLYSSLKINHLLIWTYTTSDSNFIVVSRLLTECHWITDINILMVSNLLSPTWTVECWTWTHIARCKTDESLVDLTWNNSTCSKCSNYPSHKQMLSLLCYWSIESASVAEWLQYLLGKLRDQGLNPDSAICPE